MLLHGYKLRPMDDDTSTESKRDFLKPKVKAVYNLFHPHDPVAYRIEPLVDKSFASSRPVMIPYTKGGLTVYSLEIRNV